MSFPLYYNNGSYYLIIEKGMSFNVAIECNNSSNRFISNEDLNSYAEVDLNSENINKLLKSLGKDAIANSADNGYLLFNNQLFHINNWRDVFNIIRS